MVRRSGKALGLAALVVFLLVVVALVPYLKRSYPRQFPEGFRNVDCKGVTCNEGEFCMENVCRPIVPPIVGQPRSN